MPSHTATGKQKERHGQAGVQVASRTLQNLNFFFDLGVSGGRSMLMALAASHREAGRDSLCMLEGSVPELSGRLTSL